MPAKAKPARYMPASLDAFRGNPLIEALPDFLKMKPVDIFRMLARSPEPISNLASRRQRAQWLMNAVMNCFIPGMRHMQLHEIIDLMIRQGYLHRAPSIGPKYFDDAQKRFREEAEFAEFNYHEPLSTSVIGCSGIGKTSGVMRVLSLYDQVIDHKPPYVAEPIRQVVYIKVETPGTVKALCASIITELGRLTGIDYAAQYVKPRATLESLQSRVVYLMSLHRVGILVLDEMQNLVMRHKNRDEIFNFIVYLSNALDVPLLFIGTPKLSRFMSSNLRTARRFGSFGISVWERYERNSQEWKDFMGGLWKYIILKDEYPKLPVNIEDAFYRNSQGIIDILLKLFILSQMKAILKFCTRQSAAERLTPDLIDEVARTDLANIAPMTEALRNGDDKSIDRFEDLSMPSSAFTNSASEIYEKIIEATETLDEAIHAQDAMNSLKRHFAALKEIAPPDLKTLIAEMMERGATPHDIVLALADETKEEVSEASESTRTLPDDFDPQRGDIR